MALGRRGDGVADDGTVVPGALPGERVRALRRNGRAETIDILRASAERVAPFCPWFGRCGGCAAQHMSEALYRHWKRSLVTEALARRGVEAEVRPLVDAHGAGRRRAVFHARFPRGALEEVGFMRARSHDIVAIDDCPIFAPALASATAAARALARDLRGIGKPLDIGVTATLDGLDVDIRGSGPLGPAETRKLIATAEALDLARVSNHGGTIVQRRPPRVAFGAALVVLPPGGFLQATEEGERLLADFVDAALSQSRKIADLFCGAGAFSLRLARSRQVFAADIDPAAVAALKRGAATTPGLLPVKAEARDLFRRPMRADELAVFDAALFDPPRAGAEAQAQAFAESAIPLVAAVSCNPASFARDARILVAAGFGLEAVTALDQFRYSPHVEIAAVFRREASGKRARRLLG